MKLIEEIKIIEDFIDNLGNLVFGRDFIICKNHNFSLQTILTSAQLTIGSIISCCKNGCIADANLLLRKYRDDMFFYLYIIIYDSEFKYGKNVNNIQEQIIQWVENDLNNLYISQILKTIGESSKLKETIFKFNMQENLDKMGIRLNNYTHGNGFRYYNCNISVYDYDRVLSSLSNIVSDLKYITISVLFLITLCFPAYIMSTDYIDYVELNEIPPYESQYWVAPFIQEFIKNNISLISDDCYDYLKNNTCMMV